MTAFGRRTNENISPNGRQAMPTPPNIYQTNSIVSTTEGKIAKTDSMTTAVLNVGRTNGSYFTYSLQCLKK
jgi:hypothetical protein